MGLPGLAASQMIEVDRIMMDDLDIPLGSMMEHAGLNLARLALALAEQGNLNFTVVAGTGSNGGGGLVAARRLKGWGFDTTVALPRKKSLLRKVPAIQLERAVRSGVDIINGIPEQPTNQIVLDAYLGYGFKPRRDKISQAVFSYLRSEPQVICLDIPSGMDSTSGKSYSQLKPIATMTIAFLKSGLLLSSKDLIGEVYVADIGVPKDVYLFRLNLSWDDPVSHKDLDALYKAFSDNPLQKVAISSGTWTIDKV